MSLDVGQFKKVLVVNQSSTTNAATASGNIDTRGFNSVTIDVLMTTSDDATNNPSVLKITESDDTVVTNFAAITALTGDGAGGFTIPNAITAATNITGPFATFNLNLQGRKRYLKVSVSPVTTQIISVLAQLGRAEAVPTTASAVGSSVLVTA